MTTPFEDQRAREQDEWAKGRAKLVAVWKGISAALTKAGVEHKMPSKKLGDSPDYWGFWEVGEDESVQVSARVQRDNKRSGYFPGKAVLVMVGGYGEKQRFYIAKDVKDYDFSVIAAAMKKCVERAQADKQKRRHHDDIDERMEPIEEGLKKEFGLGTRLGYHTYSSTLTRDKGHETFTLKFTDLDVPQVRRLLKAAKDLGVEMG